MVKPILILGGAVPVIIAILIFVPLVTNPEIPFIAVDPDDVVEIEFTKHELIKSSFGVTERFGAQQTEIISLKNDNSIMYSMIKDGIPQPEKKSSINHESNSYTVNELLKLNKKYKQIYRIKSWVRRGYVEELFEIIV